MITSWLGVDHGAAKTGEGVRAIHLNLIGLRPADGPQTAEEREWVATTIARRNLLGAYFGLQSTRPQSLAWLGAGNPIGQAAWIVERFQDWSDLVDGDLEKTYPLDRLLTNVMIYVMSDSFGSAAWFYQGAIAEHGMGLSGAERCTTPTAFTDYPGGTLYHAPPRSWVDRAYDVSRWVQAPRGGHFAAMEAPDYFVDDLRAWARDYF